MKWRNLHLAPKTKRDAIRHPQLLWAREERRFPALPQQRYSSTPIIVSAKETVNRGCKTNAAPAKVWPFNIKGEEEANEPLTAVLANPRGRQLADIKEGGPGRYKSLGDSFITARTAALCHRC